AGNRGLAGAAECLANRGNHLVADGMAKGVVDLLEVIDVGQEKGRACIRQFWRFESKIGGLFETAPVEEPGEKIGAGLGSHSLDNVGNDAPEKQSCHQN